MARRCVEEWQALFAEQAASGLTVAAFCKERGMCNGYFAKRRRQLIKGEEPAKRAFVPVQVTSEPVSGLQLHWQGLRLELPGSVSAHWVADLFKALA